jgi:hypothetical protein
MPEVYEDVINVKLAEIFSRDFGIDARAERVRGRRRPDIKCYYKGFIICIEASYNNHDAERDAERRIEQGLTDIALALWLKERYTDMPECELTEAIRKSKFDIKIFVPLDVRGTLIPFLEGAIEKKAEPATGWFEDIDLPMIKTIIENSISFLVREEEIQRLMREITLRFNDFINALKSLNSNVIICRNLYDTLYKLYGLSVAEAQDPDVLFGHAALSILLSTVFYEHIRNIRPELKPITEHVNRYGPINGLKKALEDLLKIDYRIAVELALEILNILPPNIMERVRDLIDLAISIASNRGLLRKDFAGRIYHEITGDIALKKGFATYYTEVPAAYLLAMLATLSLLGLEDKDLLNLNHEEVLRTINQIKRTKIGDFTCGSGTLLTASYNALMHIATALKFYHNLEDVDLDYIGKTLIEEGIYGIDALRYASQITATNLALIGPSIIEKENIYTIYLGYIPKKNEAWLGSLELLNNSGRVGGLLAFIEEGLRGIAEKVTLEEVEGEFSIPTHFDMLIMNPPFTRPTYRGKKKVPEEKRAFFGFITDEKTREKLRSKYKKKVLREITNELRDIAQRSITCELKDLSRDIKEIIIGSKNEKLRQYLNIGLAGEALPFLYLAYKYTGEGSVIAFVLPRAILAGVSWFLARVLLASKFHLKYVIVSSDPTNGYNFSEGASLSETLLVAKKIHEHEPSEETMFIILTKKPRSSLEGMLVANSIIEAKKKRIPQYLHGGVEFITRIVGREALLKYIDNWNRFVAISEPILSDYMFKLLTEGLINIGELNIKIPLVRLGDILKTINIDGESTKSIGIDAHQFYDLYREVSTSPYPALIGTGEEFRKTMKIRPTARITPLNDNVKDKAINIFRFFAGKILVPGVNIWWDTSHVIALYSDQEMLSNTHYAIKLSVDQPTKPYAEKALVLWFNTTWGLLSILINREETRGRWAQMKMGQWMLIPVLDVTSLNCNMVRKLAEIFDRYAEEPLRRIPEQFNPENPDPNRLGIDMEFIKAFSPTIDDGILRRWFREFYGHVNTTFKLWIGSE